MADCLSNAAIRCDFQRGPAVICLCVGIFSLGKKRSHNLQIARIRRIYKGVKPSSRIALTSNLASRGACKLGVHGKRLQAAWNHNYLLRLLGCRD